MKQNRIKQNCFPDWFCCCICHYAASVVFVVVVIIIIIIIILIVVVIIFVVVVVGILLLLLLIITIVISIVIINIIIKVILNNPPLWSRRPNHRVRSTKVPPSQSCKRRCVACQHSPDDQTLRLQAGPGEDDVIHLPSVLDRVGCERQGERRRRLLPLLLCFLFAILTLMRLSDASEKLDSFMKREFLLKPPESCSVDTFGFQTCGMAAVVVVDGGGGGGGVVVVVMLLPLLYEEKRVVGESMIVLILSDRLAGLVVQGVHLESGRSGVRILLATGFFRLESYQ